MIGCPRGPNGCAGISWRGDLKRPSAEECAMFVLFDDPREHADGVLDILKFYYAEAMIG